MTIQDQTTIASKVVSSCTTEAHVNDKMYQCMDRNFGDDKLTEEYLISQFNKQFGTQAKQIWDFKEKIFEYWPVYIMTVGNLDIQRGSFIKAPRIGICTSNLEIDQSLISSRYLGCTHDKGLGAMPPTEFNNVYCAGAGAAHGGNGGAGGVLSQDKAIQEKCAAYYHSPYYFGSEAFYEGSGGGSGDVDRKTGGQGGGIIWLSSAGKTVLTTGTHVGAEGGDGTMLD